MCIFEIVFSPRLTLPYQGRDVLRSAWHQSQCALSWVGQFDNRYSFLNMANAQLRAVATPILANSGNDVSQAPLKAANSMDNALRRFGDPEELAECLVWLTSSRASYVTATVLAANGGQIGG